MWNATQANTILPSWLFEDNNLTGFYQLMAHKFKDYSGATNQSLEHGQFGFAHSSAINQNWNERNAN